MKTPFCFLLKPKEFLNSDANKNDETIRTIALKGKINKLCLKKIFSLNQQTYME